MAEAVLHDTFGHPDVQRKLRWGYLFQGFMYGVCATGIGIMIAQSYGLIIIP